MSNENGLNLKLGVNTLLTAVTLLLSLVVTMGTWMIHAQLEAIKTDQKLAMTQAAADSDSKYVSKTWFMESQAAINQALNSHSDTLTKLVTQTAVIQAELQKQDNQK